jgi:hypothetical protein
VKFKNWLKSLKSRCAIHLLTDHSAIWIQMLRYFRLVLMPYLAFSHVISRLVMDTIWIFCLWTWPRNRKFISKFNFRTYNYFPSRIIQSSS